MANLSLFPLAFLIFILLLQMSRTTTAKNQTHNAGMSFELIHRDDALHSPSNLTVEEKIDRLIHLSDARMKFLNPVNSNNSSLSLEINQIIRPPIYHQFGQSIFLVRVGIGTFAGYQPSFMSQYLALDTAGGEIWIQCEGCNPCFHQTGPFFPRSRSQSYRAFWCRECPRGSICEQDHCRNRHGYEDGTQVQGIAASETFTFGSNDAGAAVTMEKLKFTCVIHSQNVAIGMHHENMASGLIGMSRRPASFMSQVGSHFGNRFSYCMTSVDYQGQPPPMFLRFGNDIPPLSSVNQRRTPLLQGGFPYYQLDLRGISVGSQTLNVNPSVFQLRSDGSGGCIIDSGAGLTRVIRVAYTELVRVLTRKALAKNPGITISSYEPRLCFRQPRPRARTRFPRLTFHFANNANFVVKPEAYMLGFAHPNPQVYCIMISPSDRFTAFGVSQQVNHRVVYDLANSELRFAEEDCFSNN